MVFTARRLRRHWQPLVDVTLAAATSLLFALSGTAVSAPLAVLQLAPLVVRRRWPAAVLVVVAAATAVHTTLGMARAVGFFPVTIALYTAAVHSSPLIRWVLCPAAGVAVAAASAVRHGVVEGLLMAIVTVTVAWLAGVERGEHLRQRREAVAAEERERVARRVHDSLAHSVTVMLLQTEALRATTPLDPAGEQRVETVLRAGRTALAEVRAALAGDDPSPVLATRLAELRAAGLRLAGPPPPSLGLLAAPVRAVAERVIGEAASNALRHDGPGALLTITATEQDGAMLLRVTSETAGGRAGRGGAGFGLRSLREDVERCGGRLVHGPLGDTGWRIEATLPHRAP